VTEETPPRRFCRFRTGTSDATSDYQPLPSDGLCLSAYVLLRSAEGSDLILVGEPDAAHPWDRIGALSRERIRSGAGWMLPASHLALFEGPDDAAHRILVEQLGDPPITLRGPRAFSEAYRRRDDRDPHWDLHFLYEGEWPRDRPLPGAPWRTLEFLAAHRTSRRAFRRGHEDVLSLAGVTLAP